MFYILSTGGAGQEVSPHLPAGGAEDVAVEAAVKRGASGGHLRGSTILVEDVDESGTLYCCVPSPKVPEP